MYKLKFDGTFRQLNEDHTSGFMGFGWVVYRDETVIAQGYGIGARANDATSNVAEYLALTDGLEMLLAMDIGGEEIAVAGDSRVVIHQMLGRARVNGHRIRPYFYQACHLSHQLSISQWHWIPRQYNKLADSLARKAINDLRYDRKAYHSASQHILKDKNNKGDKLHILMGMNVVHNDRIAAFSA